MQVRDVMSAKPEVVPSNASIREAAVSMRDNGAGMVPLYDNEKLIGTVTDRDLVTRALAEGRSMDEAVSQLASDPVLYCFQDDDVTTVLNNMKSNEVQRLVVLDNKESKNLVGVVSVGDIADHCKDDASKQAIVDCCKQYH